MKQTIPLGVWDVRHGISLEPSTNPADLGVLASQLTEVAGVKCVEEEPSRHRIRITYDATKVNFQQLLDELTRQGGKLSTHWWFRLRAWWFQYMDETSRDNAQAPPPAVAATLEDSHSDIRPNDRLYIQYSTEPPKKTNLALQEEKMKRSILLGISVLCTLPLTTMAQGMDYGYSPQHPMMGTPYMDYGRHHNLMGMPRRGYGQRYGMMGQCMGRSPGPSCARGAMQKDPVAYMDQALTSLKQRLAISEQQQAVWEEYAQAQRGRAALMASHHQVMREAGKKGIPSEQHQAMRNSGMQQMRQINLASNKLFAQLTPEQRLRAGNLLMP